MARTPERERDVFVVGAGLSCALGLPNTASLVADVLDALESGVAWRHSGQLNDLAGQAFKYFYPDGTNKDFRPSAVDFFSTLKSYMEISTGFPGGFSDAPVLYRKLKFAIAHLLVEKLRLVDTRLAKGHEYLSKVVQPGNIVVTSNWDTAIERYALLHEVPVRFSGHDESELAVLKLHGSLDWTLGQHMTKAGADYALPGERLHPPQPHTLRLPKSSERDDVVFRIRALEQWNGAWSLVSSRTTEPHIVTMARGKAGDLGPLDGVWRDAYAAVSRAENLEIVGYSMPDDDIEIRTLLRAGVERGTKSPRILVRNPAPDVHDRVRGYLDHKIRSDYRPVNFIR